MKGLSGKQLIIQTRMVGLTSTSNGSIAASNPMHHSYTVCFFTLIVLLKYDHQNHLQLYYNSFIIWYSLPCLRMFTISWRVSKVYQNVKESGNHCNKYNYSEALCSTNIRFYHHIFWHAATKPTMGWMGIESWLFTCQNTGILIIDYMFTMNIQMLYSVQVCEKSGLTLYKVNNVNKLAEWPYYRDR